MNFFWMKFSTEKVGTHSLGFFSRAVDVVGQGVVWRGAIDLAVRERDRSVSTKEARQEKKGE
jgi:hypothetical protein